MRATRPAFGFIFISIVLEVLGFGLLIPVGPRLVEGLLNDGRGGTEAEAAPVFAALMTTFFAVSFIFSATLGALSDRLGRRPILLISMFGSGLDYFAQAFAPSLTWLFVARAINGLSGASITVANAYIADVTAPEQRAKAFGMAGAAFGLGFVLGPAAGGFLGDIDIRLPFMVAGGLTLLNWLYGYFVLPESLHVDHRRSLEWKRINPVGAFGALFHHRLVTWMGAAIFMLRIAEFGLHATWVLYTAARFGWSARDVGLSLTAVGIGAAIVQGGLARSIIPALGEKKSLMLGLALGVGAYLGYGLVTEGWMLYVVIAFASLGGIALPSAQSLITRVVGPREQGSVQGAIMGLQSVAGIFAPLIGGFVLEWALEDEHAGILRGSSFYCSAAFAAVGWILASVAIRYGTDAARGGGTMTAVPNPSLKSIAAPVAVSDSNASTPQDV